MLGADKSLRRRMLAVPGVPGPRFALVGLPDHRSDLSRAIQINQ